MLVLGILSIAIAPGLFWMWFFYSRGKLSPRPRRLVVRVFVLGMIFSLPVMILEMPFICCGFILTLYAAPFIEEGVKFFVVHQGVAYRKEFREPMDGIVYAASASLGFATIENIFYIIEAYASETLFYTAIIRAVLTVPGHALWGIMWGYPLGAARFQDRETSTNQIILGLLLAMVCHGGFNLFAILNVFHGFGLFILIFLYWMIVRSRIQKARSFKFPEFWFDPEEEETPIAR